MRVAHINLSTDFRGGETQTLALVDALRELHNEDNSSDILIVRRGTRLHDVADRIDGLEVRAVRPSLFSAGLAARDADVVHIHEGRAVKAAPLISMMGIPVVITRRITKRPKSFFLTRWTYSRAAYIAGVSNAVSAVMAEYAPSVSVGTIYDCLRSLPVTGSPDLANKTAPFVVATIAELHIASKGQDLVIDIAREIEESDPDIGFEILGSGKDEQTLKDSAKGLGNVHFLGFVTNIQDRLPLVDVILHPARTEGLGSAIIEAMSFSIPAIATRVGGIPEVVEDQYNGILTDKDQVDAMRAGILRLARDPELRGQLAENALETAGKFSAERMAGEYQRVYEEITSP